MTQNGGDEMVLTSVQQAAWAEHQLREAAMGNLDSIVCPYCGSNVLLGIEEFCCGPMIEATAILLDRMEAVGFDANDAEEASEAVDAAAVVQPRKINAIQ
jgi:hypothetical protein